MSRFWTKSAIVATVLTLVPLAANAEILRNLKMGDKGEDVRELQTILNKDSATKIAIVGPGSPGSETNYFGVLTKLAVIKLQEKYVADILTPAGLKNGTGFVGSQTRIFLLQLANRGSSSVSVPAPQSPVYFEPPVITAVSPAVITKSTTSLTVTGFNFTSTGNTVVVSSESPTAFTNIPSVDGKTITFDFHFSNSDILKKQFAPIIASGKYSAFSSAFTKNVRERVSPTGNAQIPVQVSIRNANGNSATFRILVDLTEILKEIGQ